MKRNLMGITFIVALAGTAALAQPMPEAGRGPAHAARLAGADANADGNITLEELTAFIAAERAAREAKMAEEMIKRLDRNADGQLQADELTPRSPHDFATVDKNGDGQISEEEFKAYVENQPRREGRRHEGKGGHEHRHFTPRPDSPAAE